MMLSIFVNLSFLVYKTIGYSYDCSDTNSLCKNTNIDCLSNQDCFISCNSDELCQNSVITCPINGNCNIECRGYKSCQNLIINATISESGNINILCQDASQECESLSIYGSIYNTNTEQNDLNLRCNGDLQSCSKSNIRCPASGDCLVQCQSDESCKNNTISGPINGDLIVQCTGKSSCIQSRVKAENSDELDLSGCSQSDSCLDLTIYCPPMTNISNPNCLIQGNDNLGSYSGQGINIYAINGWQDVEISYSGSYGLRHQGTMHCGFAYDTQCPFASSSWSCTDIDAFCNNVVSPDTSSPTDAPAVDTTANVPISDINVTDSINTYASYPEETYFEFTPPDIKHNFAHGALGMILIGGGLIIFAFACVICGAIRKQMDKAQRKLSDMGFKSPFKSPYSGPAPKHFPHPHAHKHKPHSNMDMAPHRIADRDTSYSHGMHGTGHNSGYYATHGIHRPDTANSGHGHSQTYTANIHRPESQSHHAHNGTRTAQINRPNSTMSNHSNHHTENYNEYGQHHLAQLGMHGHSGHNTKGFKAANGSGHGHSHRHQHASSHGQGQGHVRNKRSKHNTEMIPIR